MPGSLIWSLSAVTLSSLLSALDQRLTLCQEKIGHFLVSCPKSKTFKCSWLVWTSLNRYPRPLSGLLSVLWQDWCHWTCFFARFLAKFPIFWDNLLNFRPPSAWNRREQPSRSIQDILRCQLGPKGHKNDLKSFDLCSYSYSQFSFWVIKYVFYEL